MFMVAGVWGRGIPITEDQEAEKSPHKPEMGIHSDPRLPARLPSVSGVSSGLISECETGGDTQFQVTLGCVQPRPSTAALMQDTLCCAPLISVLCCHDKETARGLV